jgi:hypothetical protein
MVCVFRERKIHVQRERERESESGREVIWVTKNDSRWDF